MKTKYQRLSKKEKRIAIEEYKNASENNENVVKRLKRLRVVSIIGVIYAIISFIIDLIFDTISVWSYVIDGLLLIFCVIFMIKSKQLLEEQVNIYLIKKDQKPKKKNKVKDNASK